MCRDGVGYITNWCKISKSYEVFDWFQIIVHGNHQNEKMKSLFERKKGNFNHKCKDDSSVSEILRGKERKKQQKLESRFIYKKKFYQGKEQGRLKN